MKKEFRRFFCSIILEQFRMNFTPKSANIFSCKICNFTCSKKYDLTRHMSTRKHENRTKLNEKSAKSVTAYQQCIHICKYCQKGYNARNSLWYHEKKCIHKQEYCMTLSNSFMDSNSTNDLTSLVLEVVKQNQELQKHIVKICETGSSTNNNSSSIQNSNINSNNKTFNLNVFLNEQCKDAMNLTDFVDSLQLQLTDLEKIGELGYVNGLSSIIIRNLKAMDIHKRPVHCSDAKRETIFIKEADKWEKENDENEKLNKAIKSIANKNIRMIPKWREKHPECAHSDSYKSDQYNNIIIQSLDTNPNSNPKIIKNIAKEVKIEKENSYISLSKLENI